MRARKAREAIKIGADGPPRTLLPPAAREPHDRDRKADPAVTYCRPCSDWTEHRLHIGGAVGAALTARCLALGWPTRQRDSRALTITPAGRRRLDEVFGVTL